MRIFNKRASFEYELTGEKIEAGIVLTGMEAKAVRTTGADLSQAYVKILGNEVFLINANIASSTGSRKLLLHRKEILALTTKMHQGKLAIVPVELYNKKRLVKLKLTLGKPKRKFEKKEAVKQMDIQRDIDLEFKNR
ncbi:MAG TPA: SsrA-binding protein [Alphaproteobacteria bacterium]|jgi:SsrA-binding protein|nr:SsrA-binding protein [Alphaproteobacteria bacterium]